MTTTGNITIRPAQAADLPGILLLQQESLGRRIHPDEARAEGFVTLEHTLPILEEMNRDYPHTVALIGDRVVGYALSMQKTHAGYFPIMAPMFDDLDKVPYKGVVLGKARYCVMGQICVAKDCRGLGLAQSLLEDLAARMSAGFDYMVTDISEKNPRSLRAHQKAGFEELCRFGEAGGQWVVVVLPLDRR